MKFSNTFDHDVLLASRKLTEYTYKCVCVRFASMKTTGRKYVYMYSNLHSRFGCGHIRPKLFFSGRVCIQGKGHLAPPCIMKLLLLDIQTDFYSIIRQNS